MCGISIIISPEKNVNENVLRQMNAIIVHRGPNDEGFYFNEEKTVGLGHRRLSIIDLTEAGHQPMFWKDRYVITYNGEIYNYIELKKELEDVGYRFSTHSDTEVILAAYEYWGKDCQQKFNGMWAFCIYDKVKKTAFISRDRFGVKPLYYTSMDGVFYAGSEIKQLLESGMERRVNKQVLMNYLVLGMVEQDEQTFFESINSLPSSHYLEYDLQKKSFVVERYYSLRINEKVRKYNLEEAVNGYHQLLQDSITIRLRSDVKVGTCLSGGLDSSYIASYGSSVYRKNSGQKFTGITASSLDAANDEQQWAKLVADRSDLNWQITQPDKADFLSVIDKVITSQEEPFGTPSIIMQYFVMEKSASLGCTVLLDGQGGDETLLGYERYYASFLNNFSLFKKFEAFKNIAKNSKLTLKQAVLMQFYFTNFRLRKYVVKSKQKLLNKEYFKFVDWEHLKKLSDAAKNVDDLQYFEITKSCLPHLLKYEDRNSMSQSIETRLPFLDYRAVEFAYSINPELKIQDGWTKFILRKGAKNVLPDDITWRKNKYGFESPDNIWMNDRKLFFDEIKKSPLLNKIYSAIPEELSNEQLWRLFNIARWESIYQVQS